MHGQLNYIAVQARLEGLRADAAARNAYRGPRRRLIRRAF